MTQLSQCLRLDLSNTLAGDGKMLAERLVTHYPEVQVIFMSGAAESSQIGLNQFDSGALFLQKPFSSAALASIVREALDRHKVSC